MASTSSNDNDGLNGSSESAINNYIESSYYNSLDLNTIDDIVNAFAVINNYSLLNNMSIRESEETLLGISPSINNQVNLLFLDISISKRW